MSVPHQPDAAARAAAPETDHPAIDAAVVQRAAEWMARLWSDDATDAQRAACARWRAAHPHHELAWHRLQAFESRLHSVPGEVARHALREPAAAAWQARRRAMQGLGLLAMAGSTGYLMGSLGGWRTPANSHRTDTGEIRDVALPDGSQVVLGSAARMDVLFNADERLLVLVSGEILVTTAPDPVSVHRPFRVRDAHGVVEALGTRFSLQQHGDHSAVAVFQGAVEVRPQDAGGQAMRIDSGQRVVFTRESVRMPAPVSPSDEAWARGVLVAEDMRLDAFVEALARYRHGFLRCDPSVAHLKVTGVFSLRDTDRALQNLVLGLPVTVVWRSRWWGMVRAASPA